jgi:translocation and assembly module TamB
MMVGRSIYASEENEQSLIGAAASALGVRGVNEITSRLGAYLPIDEIYLDGSSSSEDMSLVLGKHITEDLFIGYDHNFFDATGEFRVNYNLGLGFSVETKSSVNSTSGDILYSIEH